MIRCSLCLILSMIALVAHSETPAKDASLRFFTEEYAPFSFSDNSEIRGINSEVLKRTIEELGLDVSFHIVPWGRAQLATQQDTRTCFFSAARTPAREDIYQWVGPLTREQIKLYSLNPDSPKLETLQDARDYRVGGQTADAYSNWVERQGIPVEGVTEVHTNLEKLKWDRIDLWLAGSIAGPYIAAQQGMEIYPQAASEDVFELWLACNPEVPQSLIRRLNETVERFKNDGTLEAIQNRYHKAAELGQFPAPEAVRTRLVTWGDWGPFADEDLPDNGMASAIAREVFETPGREVKVVFHPWERAYSEAKEGLFQAAFPYAYNEERARDFLFTEPLFSTTQRLFAARNHTESEAAFTGSARPSICLPRGYNQTLVARLFQETDFVIERPREMVHCLRMALLGRVDFVLVSEAVGWYIIDSQPELERDDFLMMRWRHENTVHIMIPKALDNAESLLEDANARIQQMKADGTMEAIIERYQTYLQ